MTAERSTAARFWDFANAKSPASLEAMSYLLQNAPNRRDYDLYYWYYGTLAVYHNGDRATWMAWNNTLRDTLVADQRKDDTQPVVGTLALRGVTTAGACFRRRPVRSAWKCTTASSPFTKPERGTGTPADSGAPCFMAGSPIRRV